MTDQSQSTLKLDEIADRIRAHLGRMEKATLPLSHGESQRKSPGFFHANAWRAGPRVAISYISYQYTWKITKADALCYLKWLDAGNEGRHRQALSGTDP